MFFSRNLASKTVNISEQYKTVRVNIYFFQVKNFEVKIKGLNNDLIVWQSQVLCWWDRNS